MIKLDPWGLSDIKDYGRLYEEFGMSPIDEGLRRRMWDNRYVRRLMVFGHRDIDKFMDSCIKGEEVAVMSGIKPTGVFHLGSKVTAEQMIYFQRSCKRATVFYSIADLEAYADNRIAFNESDRTALINVADILALGLDPKRAVVYKQSDALAVQDLAFIFSRDVTFNMLEAIYGERPVGLYFSALVQAGDILVPQTKIFGGPKPVLVPVGADQDPHIRLTRDIASKHHRDFGFIEPSSIYHKLVRSLKGDYKMSKRDPLSMITLSDGPELVKKKVMDAFTGGRATVKEQRELGGEPWKCPVYELYLYHFVDDDEIVKRAYDECVNGERICGDCKLEILKYITKFLKEHQERRERYIDVAEGLLKEGSELLSRKPF
jgi:tryptophanyl-tRNA synthetase